MTFCYSRYQLLSVANLLLLLNGKLILAFEILKKKQYMRRMSTDGRIALQLHCNLFRLEAHASSVALCRSYVHIFGECNTLFADPQFPYKKFLPQQPSVLPATWPDFATSTS